jgi:hypothetical protein
MTKTEAAGAIATQVITFAKRTGRRDGAEIIWEILSEAQNGHMGPYLAEAARTTNFRAVRTAAKKLAATLGAA